MAANDYQKEFARLSGVAKDLSRKGLARIRAAIDLAQLSLNQHSRFTDEVRAICNRVLRDYRKGATSTPKERKAAAALSEFLITGKRPAQEPVDEFDAAQVADSHDYLAGMTFEERLAYCNKDVYAEPPQKHIFFPVGHPEYLAEKFPALFATLDSSQRVNLPKSYAFDPYNSDLRVTMSRRVINPNFVKAYAQWKKRRGIGAPGTTSNWFLRFCEEGEVREWIALGTLVGVDPAQPVGKELRRREHLSGFVKPEEVRFAWELYLEIGGPNADSAFNTTPPNYLHEFDGLAPLDVPSPQ